jgi:hypothetical protein
VSEARTADRLDHLERDVGEIRQTLARLAPLIERLDATVAATLPHLATKAELTAGVARLELELEKKPGKLYLATAVGVLLVAYAAGLAGLAALPVIARLLASL